MERPTTQAAASAVVDGAASSPSAPQPRPKRFTVCGAVLPYEKDRYLTLPAPDLAELQARVEAGSFFMLHGQHGTGKTTAALQLLEHVKVTHGWHCLVVHFSCITTTSTVTAFWTGLSIVLGGLARSRGIQLAAFDSPGTFRVAFSAHALGDARVVLMLDGFGALGRAADGIKEEFFGALRAIKQNRTDYAIQSVIALGPFNILFMHSSTGSPFNVWESVQAKFFSEDQVSQLLQQYTDASGVSLEEGIVADIHAYTAGHAGLVCLCGSELDSILKLHPETKRVTLAEWQDYRARNMLHHALSWPTSRRIGTIITAMTPDRLAQLERALLAGDEPIPDDAFGARIDAARQAVAEGWLVPTDGDVAAQNFVMMSPLVRSMALHQLAGMRSIPLSYSDRLPLDPSGTVLDMFEVVRELVVRFDAKAMELAVSVSSKQSRVAAGAGGPRAFFVPDVASYHFQLFTSLRCWLASWNHADAFPEADVSFQGTNKRFADMLIIPRRVSNPRKHLVSLVATPTDADVQDLYSRTVDYMAAQSTDQGTCIVFTAVDSANAIAAGAFGPLVWPSEAQLASGLVAIHVIHDLAWSNFQLMSRCGAGGSSSRQASLSIPAPTE